MTGIYIAWIGCGYSECEPIGVFSSYDLAYNAIVEESKIETNRHAWLCIELWELDSKDPTKAWEYLAKDLSNQESE